MTDSEACARCRVLEKQLDELRQELAELPTIAYLCGRKDGERMCRRDIVRMSETTGWNSEYGLAWKNINNRRYYVTCGAHGWVAKTTNWRAECSSEADAKRAAHRHAEETR